MIAASEGLMKKAMTSAADTGAAFGQDDGEFTTSTRTEQRLRGRSAVKMLARSTRKSR
jgi:hypothetical protein